MESLLKVFIATACAATLLIGGFFAWEALSPISAPLTEEDKARQVFREAQEKDEARMLARCSEPFGPGLTEREERNRKWCISHGLLDPS